MPTWSSSSGFCPTLANSFAHIAPEDWIPALDGRLSSVYLSRLEHHLWVGSHHCYNQDVSSKQFDDIPYPLVTHIGNKDQDGTALSHHRELATQVYNCKGTTYGQGSWGYARGYILTCSFLVVGWEITDDANPSHYIHQGIRHIVSRSNRDT